MTLDQIRNDLNDIKNILSNNGIESIVIILKAKGELFSAYGYDLIRKKKSIFLFCGSSMLNYGPVIYNEKFKEFKRQVINSTIEKVNNKFTNIDPIFFNVANTINDKKELLNGKELYILYTTGYETGTATILTPEYHNDKNVNLYDGKKYPISIIVGEDMIEFIRLKTDDPRRIYEALLMTLIHEVGHNLGQNIKPSDLPRIIKNYNQFIIDKRKSHITGSKPLISDINKMNRMRRSDMGNALESRKVDEVQADNYAYKNINKFDPSVNRERAGGDLGDVLAYLNVFQNHVRNLKNKIVTKIIPPETALFKIKELNDDLSKLVKEINTKKIPTELTEKINTLKISIESLKRYVDRVQGIQRAGNKLLKDPGIDKELLYGAGGSYASPYYRKKALSGDMYKTKEYKPTQTYDHREYYDKQKNNKSNKKKP